MIIENRYKELGETVLERFGYPPIPTNVDSRVIAGISSALEFYRDYYYIPVASELLVCNLKDGYAGTLDCLGFIIPDAGKCSNPNKPLPDGVDPTRHDFSWNLSSKDWTKKECIHCGKKVQYKLALVDYKTSNHIKQKPTYCAQVSAYSKALTLMTDIKPQLHVIVRLDKHQPKYEAVSIPKINEAYKHYKLMKALSPWIDPKLEHTEPLTKKTIIKI